MTTRSEALERPRRVALVVSHLKGGGKEECVVNLANGLARDGWSPLVACLEVSGRLEAKISRSGVEVVALNKRRGNDLHVPVRLARVLKDRRIEVVHCHNWGTVVETVIASRLAGVRSIVHTQHGLDYGFGEPPPRWRTALRGAAKALCSRWVRRIVVVSEEVRRRVRTEWVVPDDKVRVIHNGIAIAENSPTTADRQALRRALGLHDNDFVVCTAGAFRPVKDLPTLVEAMAKVVRRAPHARLLLVGSGPVRAAIEATAERLEISHALRLPGWRSDVQDVLGAADLFVMSSLSEGISLALLEAMAARLPAIATRVGGNPEIIDEGRTGLLVPPKDPDRLAEAILSIVEHPQRGVAMGAEGRARVERRFTLDRMIGDYEALYAAV
jgi:sugar transferase (PEP-CTERM/EpsH1 system associated)